MSSFDVELRRNSSVNEFLSSSGCLIKSNIIFHLQVPFWMIECKILSLEEEIKLKRFDVIINFQRVCGQCLSLDVISSRLIACVVCEFVTELFGSVNLLKLLSRK